MSLIQWWWAEMSREGWYQTEPTSPEEGFLHTPVCWQALSDSCTRCKIIRIPLSHSCLIQLSNKNFYSHPWNLKKQPKEQLRACPFMHMYCINYKLIIRKNNHSWSLQVLKLDPGTGQHKKLYACAHVKKGTKLLEHLLETSLFYHQ